MQKLFLPFLVVGVGGFSGSLLRFGVTLLTQRWGWIFPWGTLISNVAGCFLIGVVVELASATALIPPSWRLFLVTGLCGGFTTMSSMVFELSEIIRVRDWLWAAVYFNATFLGCMAAYYGGLFLARTGLTKIWG